MVRKRRNYWPRRQLPWCCMAGRICFVIAHRLSTIRSASRILVVEDGRIVEMGRHEELIERRGRYFDLHAHQFARGLLATD